MSKRRFSRRVFLALLAVILWLGFLVDGSHALFTDQASLTGNSITSGTASLLISNSQSASSTIFEDARVGFTSNLSPGEQVQKYFLLKNASDGNVDFRVSLGAIIAPDSSSPLATHLKFLFEEIGADGNPTGTGAVSYLAPLENSPIETPFIIPKGTTKRYLLTTSLDSDFALQNQAASYDLVFTGVQVIPS